MDFPTSLYQEARNRYVHLLNLCRLLFIPEGVGPASGMLQSIVRDIFNYEDFQDWTIVIFDNFLILADDYEDAANKLERVIARCAEFGVILKNCKEREIEIVSGRLRAAVREHAIETCGGQVAATCSVGAVWLPGAASNSQEAMLRAEEALDRARERGRLVQ